jgi:ubiquinone/menaquinone biosynthesis C-methylase UbiE
LGLPAARILDVCGGQGRHAALELARRAISISLFWTIQTFLLDRGRWEAAAAVSSVTFCQGDARAMRRSPTAGFDVVL